MADQQRSGWNHLEGFRATETYLPDDPPDLSDVQLRLKKNRKVWAEFVDDFTEKASSYQKPDRFINDRMPVRGQKGVPPAGTGFGGGFGGGRLKLTQNDKSVRVTSNRPYVPYLSDPFIDKLVERLTVWWMDGE